MGMLDPHPALKAIVQQASPADMWLGDDFHHNGAFRLSYGFEYVYMMESSKEIADVTKVVDHLDAYDWYLRLGALSNVDEKYFHGTFPPGPISLISLTTTRSGNARLLLPG
jgi:Predicted acyl esterases